MIQIRPILPNEIPAARRVILMAAYHIFGFDGTYEASAEFQNMEDVQEHYFDNDGLFLAVLDDRKLIGTGALRRLDESVCELKRMWLLEDYHGRGIGYQVFDRLRDIA